MTGIYDNGITALKLYHSPICIIQTVLKRLEMEESR